MKYLICILLLISFNGIAQEREMKFPDVPGYQTLLVDLHIHTVFSDGSVWPDVRVYEAIRDGMDLIAMTEHLEYQPHKEDIPHPNRNRSYELANRLAEQDSLIVVNGAEITREMPPGHSNSVFITDANALLHDDPFDAFRAAADQGGFTFWNHPNWSAQKPDGIARLSDMHRQLISEGLLHGIEVVNDVTFSDEALQIALDNDLTILGTSDIHGLIDWQFNVANGGHRPMTMVFSKSRNIADIKEALMEGRTAVYFENLLVGRETHLVPLIKASLTVESARYGDDYVLPVVISNPSPVRFLLENMTNLTFHANGDVLEIDPYNTTTIYVKTLEKLDEFTLRFRILNALTAPKQHPEVDIEVITE